MTTRKRSNKNDGGLTRMNRVLRMVKLSLMRVTPFAQRKRDQGWIDTLTNEMDIDKIGTPEVSYRDGVFYIMDGQHRIEAIKQWLGEGWEEQSLQCWVAEGLNEEQEAEIFLSLNDRKQIQIFQRFRVAVNAGRPTETAINEIVKSEGLSVSDQAVPGAIHAVALLIRTYENYGPDTLRRTLRLAKNTYGDAGLGSSVLAGFALLCHRYNGVISEPSVQNSLANIRGGVNGLLGQAEILKQQTRTSKIQCIAAAAVIAINRHRVGKKKLQSWFKQAAPVETAEESQPSPLKLLAEIARHQ